MPDDCIYSKGTALLTEGGLNPKEPEDHSEGATPPAPTSGVKVEAWAAPYTKGVTLLKESTRRDSPTYRAFTLPQATLSRAQEVRGTPKDIPDDAICSKGASLLTKA